MQLFVQAYETQNTFHTMRVEKRGVSHYSALARAWCIRKGAERSARNPERSRILHMKGQHPWEVKKCDTLVSQFIVPAVSRYQLKVGDSCGAGSFPAFKIVVTNGLNFQICVRGGCSILHLFSNERKG